MIDREGFANTLGCLDSAIGVGLVALFAMKMDADLVVLGLVMLANSCFFFFLVLAISLSRGWTRKFETGLFGKFALRNKETVIDLLKTAIPLAVGSLLSYAEWEIMTVFAAILGPAEGEPLHKILLEICIIL